MPIELTSLGTKMKHYSKINSSTLKMIRPLLCAAVAMIISSCQTGSLSITSNPKNSDVFVVTQGGAKQNLGKTPLNVSMSRLQIPRDGIAEIRVEKKGYTAS